MSKTIPSFEPFDEVDFSAFEEKKRRDSFYNEVRLRVKKKLGRLGKILDCELPSDLDLKHRTSLSHPYSYNKYYVGSQRLYFARSDRDRKGLRKHLGPAFSKDLDSNYIHIMLVVEIDLHQITTALRIHNQAWWDGQNLIKKGEKSSLRKEFLDILNELEGFVLSIHDWKREYRCGELKRKDIKHFLKYYTPGEHWFHLRRHLPKSDPRAMEEDALDWIEENLLALLPAYRFIAWSPSNNYLF